MDISYLFRIATAILCTLFTLLPHNAQAQKVSNQVLIDELIATGLPLVNITTVDGVWPSCYYLPTAPPGCSGSGITNATKVPSRMTITLGDSIYYDSGEYAKDKSGMTLKIRGNTSAYSSYPSYKIKLQKKANLLNFSDSLAKDKEWALLNRNASGNLKTYMGKEIAKLCGIDWEPADHFVNVIINGNYRGVYLLSELVKRGEGRCNVSKSGFVAECDPYWWVTATTDSCYHTKHLDYALAYTFKYPDAEDLDSTRFAYFKRTIDEFEDCLYNNRPFDHLFDMQTLASWFLAHDISGSWDGFGSNIFITKGDSTSASRLRMGPLWDFDMDYKKPGEWASVHVITEFYGNQLFKQPSFVNAYNNLWQRVCPQLHEHVRSQLENLSTRFEEPVQQSREIFRRVTGITSATFTENVTEVEQWFTDRLPWLDENINGLVTSFSGVTSQVRVYATDGILLFQGTPLQFSQWLQSRRTSQGVIIVTYFAESGRVLRTTKMIR